MASIDADLINERIEVLCIFNIGASEQDYCFPRKIKHRGKTVEFTELVWTLISKVVVDD